MKTGKLIRAIMPAVLTFSMLVPPRSTVFAQGTTAFTYQGQLRDNGTNANGAYTMFFKLYDAVTGGNQIGDAITNNATLANGLFTVNLDFGAAAFDGNGRWLDISIANTGIPETLSPRVHILPVPYAIMSGSASSALIAATASSVAAVNVQGTLADDHLSGNVALRNGGNVFTGDQTVSGGSIGIGSSPTESLLINGGNAFIIGANSSYPGISGSLFFGSNPTTRDGALLRTTAGDMAFWRYDGFWHETMRILNSSGLVGIGKPDPATALDVSGTITATSFNGNGSGLNSLSASQLSDGTLPDARLSANVALRIGGNALTGDQTIAGGKLGIGTTTPVYSLDIHGNMSLPAGSAGSIYFDGANASGQEWQLFHNASEPFGPANSLVVYNSAAQSSAMVIAPSGNVGIGKIAPSTALDVNGIVAATSFSGDGSGLTSLSATQFGSGTLPDARLSSNVAQRAGGNAFTGDQAITVGKLGIGTTTPGYSLDIHGNMSLPAGSAGSLYFDGANATDQVWQLFHNASEPFGPANSLVVYNSAAQSSAMVFAPSGNVGIGKISPSAALDVNGTVAASGFSGDGSGLTSLSASQFGSGTLPDARLSSNVAQRAGGNAFTGDQAITGGKLGIGTTTPGYSLDIHGNMSLPAGSAGSLYFDGANATDQVWQLFHNASEPFGPPNSLVVYNSAAQSSAMVFAPSGNVGIGKIAPSTALDVNGTITCASLNQTSDRNAKEHFAPISPQEILDRVAALSITRWNYKGDDITRHVGPMAQDFYTAFNVGTDDKHISVVDEGGVALAAIQGLNQKLEEETKAKDARITELEKRLAELESLQKSQIAGRNGGHQ
jgi:hypothetical protein